MVGRRIGVAAACGVAAAVLFAVSCGTKQTGGDAAATGPAPVFSLAWSEYPSWSAFGVAHEFGIINGERGKLGPVERTWGVDIELKQADYDPCLTMYAAGQCDAVCITNMDVLNPSLRVKSVAVLPTSTSDGADACITVGIDDVTQLKGRKVYGLEKTVSEYCFVRNLEILGQKESDYQFTNMDPAEAAKTMVQGQAGYEAIVVWNPFVLETLSKRSDAKVLFDSTTIPGEIVDMVVVSAEALAKPRGEAFACAVVDAFYKINERIEAPATRDESLVALGEKFSHLDLAAMKKVVEQTKFYKTPADGTKLYTSAGFQTIMERVVAFCVSHDIVPQKPSVGYGDAAKAGDVRLRIDPSYIAKVAARK